MSNPVNGQELRQDSFSDYIQAKTIHSFILVHNVGDATLEQELTEVTLSWFEILQQLQIYFKAVDHTLQNTTCTKMTAMT